MGYKSRGCFFCGICLKDCKNRGKKCNECYRFSKFKPRIKKRGDDGIT